MAVPGRLALEKALQGKCLGRALVRDANLRLIHAADTIGIRGLLVHALSAETRVIYERIEFDQSPPDPMKLMMTLSDLKASL